MLLINVNLLVVSREQGNILKYFYGDHRGIAFLDSLLSSSKLKPICPTMQAEGPLPHSGNRLPV